MAGNDPSTTGAASYLRSLATNLRYTTTPPTERELLLPWSNELDEWDLPSLDCERSEEFDIPELMRRQSRHIEHEEVDAAIRILSHVIELSPNHHPARLIRSALRATQGDLSGAKEDALHAMEIAPWDPVVAKHARNFFKGLSGYAWALRSARRLLNERVRLETEIDAAHALFTTVEPG
jgi:hypothetical protein